MTITIDPGNSLLILFTVIFAVIIILMFLRPGQRGQKILSLIILLIVFGAVYFFFGKSDELVLDNNGVSSKIYGKINFEWEDVTSAEIIEDYKNTGWKPSVKINGVSVPGFRTGSFKLSNGQKAKVIIQKSENAVIFHTDEGIILFAVNEQDKLIEFASKYVDL